MRWSCHQDREVVGSSKSCGKGLCPECAVDLLKALACRGPCEEDTGALIRLIDHNILDICFLAYGLFRWPWSRRLAAHTRRPED